MRFKVIPTATLAFRVETPDGKKKKLKRRLPQWAQEELKETAKRVREEHADPDGKGRQPAPQVSKGSTTEARLL